MEIIMLALLCSGFLLFLGMAAAIEFDKPGRAYMFFFLTVTSEVAALVVAVVMVFLNL